MRLFRSICFFLVIVSTHLFAQSAPKANPKIVETYGKLPLSLNATAHRRRYLPESGLNFASAVAYDSGGHPASVAVAMETASQI